jgi:tetratricopeptide (TPR) repeat protein
MARFARLLATLLLACAGIARGAESESALGDLSSPYQEVRLAAVRRLARAGPEVREKLIALYPTADFRTKALVLDVFATREDAAGLELLFRDLVTEDRGVAASQRGLLSSLFGAVRDLAKRELAPRVRSDWRMEEALRVLPAREPTARTVLASLARSPDAALGEAARRAADRIADLDRARARLAGLVAEGTATERVRARVLLGHLARHDVERGMLAVHEAGSEGYYDGMYSRLECIVRESGEAGVYLRVLAHVIRDDPWPEDGVPGSPTASYGNLEPVPRDLGHLGVRQVAAQALGDVGTGHPQLAASLAGWLYENAHQYTEYENQLEFDIALSLAALGEQGPLQVAIGEFRDRLEQLGRGGWALLERERISARLAGAYGRLGRHREAADLYRKILAESGQFDPVTRYNLACALARDGQPDAAMQSLRLAVRYGYGKDPSQITWLERDGDLESLRDLPEFEALVREARRR